MKIKELAVAMGVPPEDYGSFRSQVKKLIADGDLVRLKRGRIGPADQMDIVVGKISINRAGTGFVLREGEEDLLIPSAMLHTAMRKHGPPRSLPGLALSDSEEALEILHPV